MKAEPGRILRIHIAESDRYGGKPLFEAIIAKCRELKIAGATVFQGLEGYGETGDLHRAHLITHDQPIVIVIVDTQQNLDRLLPSVEEMIDTGLLATSPVEMIRVERPGSRIPDSEF
jgi:PII-like signaling protein